MAAYNYTSLTSGLSSGENLSHTFALRSKKLKKATVDDDCATSGLEKPLNKARGDNTSGIQKEIMSIKFIFISSLLPLKRIFKKLVARSAPSKIIFE